MTTDYVERHGLKPAMRAFSVNDTMINGAPEHGHILAIHLPKLRTLVNPQVKFIEKIHQHEHNQKRYHRNDKAASLLHHVIITTVSFCPHQKFPDFCPVNSPPVCNSVN